MTRFRDELDSIARQAPDVDLAEVALRGARRTRTALIGGSAVAAVAALTLAVTLVIDPGGPADVATVTSGTPSSGPAFSGIPERPSPSPEDLVPVRAVLPASGVGPVRYAYYDFCQDAWKPGEDNAPVADETCLQWKVVLQDGTRYRVADALSVYTDQTKKNYMNTAAPLAISRDGRRIAYYVPERERFTVRELDTGQVWEIPQVVRRKAMVEGGGLITFSPDGRRLGLNVVGVPRVVVDVESGRVVEEMPKGWFFLSPTDEGVPMVVQHERGRLGVLSNGKVTVFAEPKTWTLTGAVGPDGTTVAMLTGPTARGENMTNGEPYDKIVTVDRTSGQVRSEARLDPPGQLRPYRLGYWLNEREVLALGGAERDPNSGRSPDLGDTVYAIDVTTGKIRKLGTYRLPPWGGSVSAPGFPGG
ncbi:hypothetical protein ACFFV7_29815 [Nonomuraea spiralis]|uniref:Uncharacterized protein n=1 Tax=Nonomuraea spiralis TaxID=46182 RepID=A0ABV5ILL2_9ACTN|nr:hypothetical protein [Nonomuraea spiralis]GGT25430.1 hypothetical protein GCM10010176_082470 [Nonomuraea spiralis]